MSKWIFKYQPVFAIATLFRFRQYFSSSRSGKYFRLNNLELNIAHKGKSMQLPDPNERFAFVFNCGQKLFSTRFNALDGGGANVGDGSLYTGVPRADLNGPGEWADHTPSRRNGPDGESCVLCHAEPTTGSGANALNIVLDVTQSADLSLFFTRNTTSLLGAGALQLLAEEMTSELIKRREYGRQLACEREEPDCCTSVRKACFFWIDELLPVIPNEDDTSLVSGVNEDLIVRPFGWKGIQASMRGFNQGAAHNDIGMQAVEVVGVDVDGDFDGVVNELYYWRYDGSCGLSNCSSQAGFTA